MGIEVQVVYDHYVRMLELIGQGLLYFQSHLYRRMQG